MNLMGSLSCGVMWSSVVGRLFAVMTSGTVPKKMAKCDQHSTVTVCDSLSRNRSMQKSVDSLMSPEHLVYVTCLLSTQYFSERVCLSSCLSACMNKLCCQLVVVTVLCVFWVWQWLCDWSNWLKCHHHVTGSGNWCCHSDTNCNSRFIQTSVLPSTQVINFVFYLQCLVHLTRYDDV